MAIDPSISLGVALPQVPDPIDQYKKSMELRDLVQQQQLNQQLQPLQFQQAQLGVQNAQLQQDALRKTALQARQQQADQEAINSAYYNPDSYDKDENGRPVFNMDKFVQVLASNKVSPAGINAFRQQYYDAAAAMAKKSTAVLDAEAAKHTAVRDGLFNVSDADTYQARLKTLLDIGALNSNEYAKLSSVPFTPEAVNKVVQEYSTAAQFYADTKRLADEREQALRTRLAAAQAIKAEQEAGVPSPELANVPQKSLDDWKKSIDILVPSAKDEELNRISKANLDELFSRPGNHAKEAQDLYDKIRQDMLQKEIARIGKATAADLATATGMRELNLLPDVMTEPPSNIKDPVTGKIPGNIHYPGLPVTPTTVWQGGMSFALMGNKGMPPQGLGSKGAPLLIRNAVVNQGAAMAAAAGTTLPELQAEYKANEKALSVLVPQYRNKAGFAYTATESMDLALQQSANVPRTGSPIANRFIQWANGHELTGNPALTELENYIYTASREYAKVTSSTGMSSADLTDTAAKKAGELISAAQTPEAFTRAIRAMKNDMALVTAGLERQIGATSATIANFLKVNSGQGGNPALGNITPTPVPSVGGPNKSGGESGRYSGPTTPVMVNGVRRIFKGTKAQAEAKGLTPTQ